MADTEAAEQAAQSDHGAHPTPKLYVQIAGVLFVLTAMEFSTYFIEFNGFPTPFQGWVINLHIPLLIVLMLVKFVLVAGFFMHLKFDTRLYTRLMAGGLIGATILYVIVLAATAEIPLIAALT